MCVYMNLIYPISAYVFNHLLDHEISCLCRSGNMYFIQCSSRFMCLNCIGILLQLNYELKREILYLNATFAFSFQLILLQIYSYLTVMDLYVSPYCIKHHKSSLPFKTISGLWVVTKSCLLSFCVGEIPSFGATLYLF